MPPKMFAKATMAAKVGTCDGAAQNHDDDDDECDDHHRHHHLYNLEVPIENNFV